VYNLLGHIGESEGIDLRSIDSLCREDKKGLLCQHQF